MKDSSAADEAMARYVGGDRAAFADLYDAVAPRLFAFLLGQLRNAALAEDLLQQTFLQVHRAHGTFQPGRSVLPWVFAIARRLAIDEHRRARHRAVVPLDDAGDSIPESSPNAQPEMLVAAGELAARLSEELRLLPASQREAFQLLRIEGLSVVEAAEVLGISTSALKVRAHRAYVTIRTRLRDVVRPKSRP